MRLTRARVLWTVGGLAVAGMAGWRLRPVPLDVEVATAIVGPLRVTLEEDGRTRVVHHVEIAAPVTGRVAENALVVGDSVRAGAAVAVITPAPLDPRSRAEAEALVAQAQSRTRETLAQLQQVRLALDDAQRARGRLERLLQAGAVPEREAEQGALLVQEREREVEGAMARVAAAREGERAARSALLGADPVAGTRPPVRVRSPIDGRVLRLFEAHDRVVVAGTPLLEVGDPRRLELVCDVLSRDAVRLAEGMRMEVRTPERAPLMARITRVEPAAFTKRSALGVDEQRVNVVAAFDGDATGLGDGFDVDVSLVLWEAARVLQLPSAALVPLDSGWAVFTVREGRARRVAVTIGQRGARDVEVLHGVDAGAVVIVRPDERVREGGRVRVASP